MKIVRLSAHDLERCLELERRNFDSPWSEPSVQAELLGGPERIALGLELDGVLKAQVFARLVQTDLHVLNLSVHHSVRRRGLASRLLEALFLHAESCGAAEAYLEVRESNRAALELYESWGFERIGTRREYYVDTREDAAVMRRELHNPRKPAK